jgi:hypothetical protein
MLASRRLAPMRELADASRGNWLTRKGKTFSSTIELESLTFLFLAVAGMAQELSTPMRPQQVLVGFTMNL